MNVKHITCPLCDKGFTHISEPATYKVSGHSGWYEKVKCPKCEAEMYVGDDTADDGLLFDVEGMVQQKKIVLD